MKTAAKVFNILSLVGGAILILVGIIFAASSGAITNADIQTGDDLELVKATAMALGIVYIVLGIVIVCVQVWLLKKLKSATNKNQLIAPAVVSIIFCGLLSGLFALLIPDNEFKSSDTTTTTLE